MTGHAADELARLCAGVRLESDRMLGLPAPAKLNLFLHVVGRRADGFHLLQTVFCFIDLADTIDIVLRADGAVVREAGLAGVAPEDDLAVRAARLLQRETGCTLGAAISVRKRIPAGGGLGGGSSDAATVLLALNRLWRLGLPRARLQALGLQLGADVPVFVYGRNAFAEGVGERLTAVDLPRRRYLVACPGVVVPTAAIFADPGLTRNTPPVTLSSFSEAACTRGNGASDGSAPFGRNDLEPVARRRFREVDDVLAWLADLGRAKGSAPRMSGSGACCFLAVDEGGELPVAPRGTTVWSACGLPEHPLFALLPC